MCHCVKGVPSVTASSCLSHGKPRDGFARWEEKRRTVNGRPKGSAGMQRLTLGTRSADTGAITWEGNGREPYQPRETHFTILLGIWPEREAFSNFLAVQINVLPLSNSEMEKPPCKNTARYYSKFIIYSRQLKKPQQNLEDDN